VTCVNEAIRKEVCLPMSKTMLLPSIIDERLIKQASNMVPFSRRPFRLGYFGGLTEEKGADIVLGIGKQLPFDWHLVVTGSGPLASSFSVLATDNPTRVRFINNATEGVLYDAMLSCDSIVNPHKSITSMGDGIFPFKVFEALATGRLLISTVLPDPGLSLADTVMFFDGSVQDLVQCLGHAEEFYQSHQPQLSLLKENVITSYSVDAVFSELSHRMSLLGISPVNRQ